MTKQIKRFSFFIIALVLAVAGCKPETGGELGEPADASFTIAAVPNRVNTYVLTSTSVNAWGYQWDKGNGTYVKGKAIDTAYFPLRGTYRVNLRAFGRGGSDTASPQTVVIAVDDLLSNPIFQQFTAKTWKLDPTPGANAIIVGTEGNPSQYFGGGGLDGCQTDDTYKFNTDLKMTYAANGATFNGGNIAPNFTCGTDRSYTNIAYTFTPGVTAGAGIATIEIPGAAVPDKFIGVTDVSSNFYRIISISANAMVLRSGTTAQAVHQFKFIAQ